MLTTPSLIVGDDLDFVFSKVLFDLTRNMLVTSSSDIFVSLLAVAQRILREKVAPTASKTTNFLAKIGVQMEFGSLDCEYNDRLFASVCSTGRLCGARRNISRHWLCFPYYSATLPSSSYQEISSHRPDVADNASPVR